MNIEPVGFLLPAQDISLAAATAESGTAAPGADFAAWIRREMGTVTAKIDQADTLLQQLATGQTDNLHQVMVGLEDAKLSFQLLVQVRNKLLEAYQDVLRMQV